MPSPKKSYIYGRCCVFQPFDGGEFDKRFDDILAPAIEDADMEPYRVDQDAGSIIPIDTLHSEIRAAVICLADITTRNPNVMYELGFAIASGKNVVIICGPTTEKFPFDIQHRSAIKYTAGSISDFTQLRQSITKQLVSLLEKQAKIENIVSASPVKSTDGLEPNEITALALILANTDSLEDGVATWTFKSGMKDAGYNELGTRLSVAQLIKLGLAESIQDRDRNDERYIVYRITERGEAWLLDNRHRLKLKDIEDDKGIADDDVPF